VFELPSRFNLFCILIATPPFSSYFSIPLPSNKAFSSQLAFEKHFGIRKKSSKPDHHSCSHSGSVRKNFFLPISGTGKSINARQKCGYGQNFPEKPLFSHTTR
jgi:hypothetical protein